MPPVPSEPASPGGRINRPVQGALAPGPGNHAGTYQRGIKFLLATQHEDGSWHTKTRALSFQPYFDAGFPHGYDQWMSAAGTSWAAMALTLALPEAGPATASLQYNRLLGVSR